jgi:hypothetical protein
MSRSMILLVLAGATGCASLQLPPDALEHFEASIHRAMDIGVYRMSPDPDQVGPFGMAPAEEHLFPANDEAEVAREMASGGIPEGMTGQGARLSR